MTLDSTTPVPIQLSTPHLIRQRVILTLACVICIGLTMWLGRVLHIPAERGVAGTIMQQPGWPLAIALAWMVLIGGSLLAAVFTIGLHEEAGLFSAAVGLAGLSVMFGPMHYVLFASKSSSVYLLMALELFLLGIAVQIAFLMRRMWARTMPEIPSPAEQNLLASAVHAVIMCILVMLLCQSDAKPQALFSVAVAAYVAAIATQYISPTTGAWICAGPTLAGVFGFCMQYFAATDMVIGDPRNLFAALARPLPLDYASLGTAGALLGFWTARKWQAEDME
ncbi:MAG TPA: hypothetical protein VHD56_13830 [Tepidisphaeraceae bacterium]|nr:hypothetical protein [Tepidisphaeraceae bacterium]